MVSALEWNTTTSRIPAVMSSSCLTAMDLRCRFDRAAGVAAELQVYRALGVGNVHGLALDVGQVAFGENVSRLDLVR